MRINTNVSALRAQGNLNKVNADVDRSMSKLSSGFRITRAADDAAGLGIANVLRADIRSLTQAARNAEQAGSVINVAEGAAGTIQKMLERMKELATQAASDNVDTSGRSRINAEYTALKNEITRTVDTVKFQGSKLLDGSFGATSTNSATTGLASVSLSGAAAGVITLAAGGGNVTATNGSITQIKTGAVTASTAGTVTFSALGFSIGVDTAVTAASLNGGLITVAAGSGNFLVSSSQDYAAQDVIQINGSTLNLTLATLTTTGSVDSLANARTSLTQIDVAIGKVSTALGELGALQSRIDVATENTKTTIQNFSAAESTIRDLDMAEEMTKFTKNQVLSQAGTAMLAQANQSAQGILTLLRG